MPDQAESFPPAPEPANSISVDAFREALAQATPGGDQPPLPSHPIPPVAETPPVSTPQVEATTPPATPAAPAPATGFDPTAYLREQFGVEQPEAIKTALATAKEAETLRANQRTSEDIAFRKLFEDPTAAASYLKLQHTDFRSLSPKELLAAKYALDHPEMPAELAAAEADIEYKSRYAALALDDQDDPDVRTAKMRLDYAKGAALQAMEQAKEAAKTAVLSKGSPQAEGPTEAEQQAWAAAWMAGVESVTGAEGLDLAYDVDGQEVKLAFDNKSPAFKEAMTEPVEWLSRQIYENGKPNYDRLAEIVALITQPDVLVKNAFAAGKASLGNVIPLDKAVNPIPAAPQPPTGQLTIQDALRQAVASTPPRSSTY